MRNSPREWSVAWVLSFWVLISSGCMNHVPNIPAVGVGSRRGLEPLVVESVLAHTFPFGDPIRYFSALDVKSTGEVLFIGKNGSWPKAVGDDAEMVAWADCDESLSCLSARKGVPIATGDQLVHNMGFYFDEGELMAVGGLLSPRSPALTQLAATGKDSLLRRVEPPRAMLPLTTSHEGCLEARPDKPICEMDGRLSHVRFRDRVLMYARANTNPRGGGRYVQVTRGAPGREWTPFEPITLDTRRLDNHHHHHHGQLVRTAPSREGGPFEGLATYKTAMNDTDIYFASVNENPVDPGGTLLGLFPTVHAVDDMGGPSKAAI